MFWNGNIATNIDLNECKSVSIISKNSLKTIKLFSRIKICFYLLFRAYIAAVRYFTLEVVHKHKSKDNTKLFLPPHILCF